MSFQVGNDKQLPEYRVLTGVQRQDNTSKFSGCSLRYFLTFRTSTRLLKSSELQEVFPEKYYFKMRRLSAHTQ